jgi:hypothetical protein
LAATSLRAGTAGNKKIGGTGGLPAGAGRRMAILAVEGNWACNALRNDPKTPIG